MHPRRTRRSTWGSFAVALATAGVLLPVPGAAAEADERRLDCQVETGVRNVGRGHSVLCIATDGWGEILTQVPVDVEATGANDPDLGNTPQTPDFTCVSDFEGWCTWTHGPPGTGTTTSTGTTVYRAWIDLDGTNAVAEADAGEARDETATPGVTPEPDATDVVSIDWEPPAADLLDCDDATGPDTESEINASMAGAASNETYTCRLTNAEGTPAWRSTPVHAEVLARGNDPDDPDAASYSSRDYTCSTGADGRCDITVTQADEEVGHSDVCFYVEVWMSGDMACSGEALREGGAADGSDVPNDAADLVHVGWTAPGPVADRIDVEPESSATPIGGSHTLTARVFDQRGSSFAEQTQVRFEFFAGSPSDPSGDGNSPQTPDATCTTAGTSDCGFVFSQATTTGTDLVCAWIGPAPVMSGTSSTGTCEGEDLTGNADYDQTGLDTPMPTDDVDVVRRVWLPPPPPPATVDCDDWEGASTEDEVNPATGPGTAQGYACTLRDSNGALVQGDVLVKAEVVDPVNDPDEPDAASFGSPDYSCSTGDDGVCHVTVTQPDSESGTTRVCFYTGSASAGETLCSAEPFDEAASGGADSGNDLADSVRLTWEPRAAAALSVSPDRSSGLLGTQHVFASVVYDQFGAPFRGNTQVKFERFAGSPSDWDGNTPATPDRTCTTADFHQCSWGYTQANHPGTDHFCAWIGTTPSMQQVNGIALCDGRTVDGWGQSAVDVVQRTWRRPATYVDCDDPHEPSTDDETNPRADINTGYETYTCKLTDSAGKPLVDYYVRGETTGVNDPDYWRGDYGSYDDYACSTNVDGTCRIRIDRSQESGTSTICFFYDGEGASPASLCGAEPFDEGLTNGADEGNDLADTVRLVYADRTGALSVDAEPEASTGAVGTDHTIAGAIYDEFGDPVVVDFSEMRFELFAGSPGDTDGNTPETPDRTCTTTWKGSECSVTYSQSVQEGTDLICAWSGATPVMTGAGALATCNGEGLDDAGDDPGIDMPSPGNDNVDVIVKTWEGPPQPPFVDCDDASGPATEDEVTPASSGETYTCKVTSAAGVTRTNTIVRAEVVDQVNDPDPTDGASYGSPDYTCTTGSDGTCTIAVADVEAETGPTVVCFTAAEGTAAAGACGSEPFGEAAAADGSDAVNDAADSVRLEWQTRVATGLDVEPEAAAGPLGAQHVITVIVYDQFGDRLRGWNAVKLERFAGSPSDWDGNTPESPDRWCSTNDNSQCSFGYTQGTYTGTDVFCAWIPNMANPVMTGSATSAPACHGEGLADDDDDAEAADAPLPRNDNVDLVTKTWRSSTPPAALDCDDAGGPATEDEVTPSASGAASTETYTCRVADASGAAIDSVVRAEATEPVNDPDSPDGVSFGTADYSCNTGADGICEIAVGQADGETGAGRVCFYAGTAAEGEALCGDEAPGEATAQDGSDGGNDVADAVRIEWQTRVASGLDVEQDATSGPLGTAYNLTAVVYDQFGDRFQGTTKVGFEWFTSSASDWNGNSPESPDRSCTTASGTQEYSQCSFTYTQANYAGTDLFCAWIGPLPAMSGTSSGGTCNGEALVDPDDDPTAFDPPEPGGDPVDVVSRVWTRNLQ